MKTQKTTHCCNNCQTSRQEDLSTPSEMYFLSLFFSLSQPWGATPGSLKNLATGMNGKILLREAGASCRPAEDAWEAKVAIVSYGYVRVCLVADPGSLGIG